MKIRVGDIVRGREVTHRFMKGGRPFIILEGLKIEKQVYEDEISEYITPSFFITEPRLRRYEVAMDEWIKKRIAYHEAQIGKAILNRGVRKYSETVSPSEKIKYHEEKIKELRKELENAHQRENLSK